MIEKKINEYNWDAMSSEDERNANEQEDASIDESAQLPPPFNPDYQIGPESAEDTKMKDRAVTDKNLIKAGFNSLRDLKSSETKESLDDLRRTSWDASKEVIGVPPSPKASKRTENIASEVPPSHVKSKTSDSESNASKRWTKSDSEVAISDFEKSVSDKYPNYVPNDVEKVTIDEEKSSTKRRTRKYFRRFRGKQGVSSARHVRVRKTRRFERSVLRKLILSASGIIVSAFKTTKNHALLIDEHYNVSGKTKKAADRVAVKAKETAHLSTSFVKQASESARETIEKQQLRPKVKHTVRVASAQVKKASGVAKETIKSQQLSPKVKHTARVVSEGVQKASTVVKETMDKHQVCPKARHTTRVIVHQIKNVPSFAAEQSIRAKESILEFDKRHQIGSKVKYTGRLLGREAKRASNSFKRFAKRTL